jgi:tRNA G10  N-methylase Trm11
MLRGMLPPKLAQVLLNLANVSADSKLLDPFCGGGTIIQEALLMGLSQVWGSDIDPKAIEETSANTEWLTKQFRIASANIAVADALDLAKHYPNQHFDAIVTEPYLGPARLLHQKRLTRQEVTKVVAESTGLYNQCMRSMAAVAAPGCRAVVIFPIIRLFGELYTVGDLHAMEHYGWKLTFPEVVHRLKQAKLSPRQQLLYSREDQIVMREITVWQRI